MFVFRYEEVFTEKELVEINGGHIPILKKYLANSMNKRLRIKEIPNFMQDPENESAEDGRPAESPNSLNYFVFFLEECQLNAMPKNPKLK